MCLSLLNTRNRPAAPREGRQVLAGGRIVLLECRLGEDIQIAEVTRDRCRYCGSETARLVHARKKKWKCDTCGKKYQLD